MTIFRNGAFVLALLLAVCSAPCRAQFTRAGIGVNGLTCSQCSRSVEVALRKLAFVKDVFMDLQHTEGTILFKDSSRVDISAIAQAVKNAGFSLRFLKAELGREGVSAEGQCLRYRGDTYWLLQPPGKGSRIVLQFIGKDYMPRKELGKYRLPSGSACGGGKVYYADVLQQ